MRVSPERFEELVERALGEIPAELGRQMRNVGVFIEDEPPGGEDLLGLYEGVPITERDDVFGTLPDRITLYRQPLCELARDEGELVEQVRITVIHEVAHYFGIDDDRLAELGWD